ncbi:MAG: hypothetical protein HC933_03265 [Pleurocapsa sp. SU_196_0]|nr:hypothetical protein [Pleurocapsa sp. SU_196_0]
MLKTLFTIAARGGIAIAVIVSLNACGSTVPSQPTTTSSTPVLRTQSRRAEIAHSLDHFEAVMGDVSARGPTNQDKPGKVGCNVLIFFYDDLTSSSSRDHDRLTMTEQEFMEEHLANMNTLQEVVTLWKQYCEWNYGEISNVPIP